MEIDIGHTYFVCNYNILIVQRGCVDDHFYSNHWFQPIIFLQK